MKLNLSLSHKAKIDMHDSDKYAGLNYFYNIENTFHVKLLKAEERGTFSISDIVAISDRHDCWWRSSEDYPEPHWYGHGKKVSRDGAESLVADAKANFERNSLLLQRACEQLGLTCNQYSVRRQNYGLGEPFTTLRLTILINREIHETLARLCSHIPNGELKRWLLQALTEFSQEVTGPVRRQAAEQPRRRGNVSSAPITRAGRQTDPHIQDFCDDCQKRGRLCSLRMERSNSAKHSQDVVIKGLPLDITGEQLREIFENYGTISRSYLPPLKPEFSSRIAFITFQNPVSALQKFNNTDATIPLRTQPERHSHRPFTPMAAAIAAGVPPAPRPIISRQAVVAEGVQMHDGRKSYLGNKTN